MNSVDQKARLLFRNGRWYHHWELPVEIKTTDELFNEADELASQLMSKLYEIRSRFHGSNDVIWTQIPWAQDSLTKLQKHLNYAKQYKEAE